MQFKTAYGEKERPVIDFNEDPGLTKQSHKDECDINILIKKYKQTGIVTHLNDMEAKYGDLVGLDFQAAMDMVKNAENLFGELPANIRKRFQNNPALFLDFMDDPSNADQMVEWGLATRRELDQLHPKTEEPVTQQEVTE